MHGLFSLCGAKTYTLPAKVASAGKYPLFKKVLLVVLSVVFAIEIVYKVCSRQLLYLLNPCHVCTVLEPRRIAFAVLRFLVHYIYGAAIALLFPETDSRLDGTWWMPLLCARALDNAAALVAMGGAAYSPGTGQPTPHPHTSSPQPPHPHTSSPHLIPTPHPHTSSPHLISTPHPHTSSPHLISTHTATPVINVQVRLVGGSTPLEGRVEVTLEGTVCDDFWTVEDAQVICRQLGFSGTTVAFSNAYFGAGSSNQPIWLDGVNCLGTETNVGQCLSGGWGIHNCVHLEDAGVRSQLVRLAGGPTPAEGRVLYYNGSPYDQKG
eukprot:Em0063g20a